MKRKHPGFIVLLIILAVICLDVTQDPKCRKSGDVPSHCVDR